MITINHIYNKCILAYEYLAKIVEHLNTIFAFVQINLIDPLNNREIAMGIWIKAAQSLEERKMTCVAISVAT